MIRRCRHSSTALAALAPPLLMLLLVLMQFELGVTVRGSEPQEASSPLQAATGYGGADGHGSGASPTMPVSNRKLLSKGVQPTPAKPCPSQLNPQASSSITNSTSSPSSSVEPFRIGFGCSNDDVAVYQSATDKLPNGIPTYTVRVLNVCASGCAVSGIHVSCGWYSSFKLVDPRVFRRLAFDDCLVNDGRPILPGDGLVFTYADSYKHPMFVKKLSCVTNT